MSHARAQAPGPPSSEGAKTFIREPADKGEFEAVQRDFGETWTHTGVYAANAKVALLAAAPATAADAASAGSPSMVRFSAAGASPVEMTPLASALESGGDDAPIDAASAAEASRAIQGAMDEMSAPKAPSSSSVRVVNTRKKVSLHVLKINGLALPSSEGPSPAVVVDSTTSFPSAANPAAPPPAAADSDDDESGFVRKRKGGQKRSQSVDAKTKKPRSRSAVPRGVQTTTFGVFSAKARAALKVSAPHLTQSEIIARISLDWATVGEDEKREYAETAGKARAAMASAQPASASEVRHEGGVAAVLDNDDDDAAAAPTDGAAGSSAARVSKMSREEATGESHSAPEEPPSKSAAPKRAQPSSTIDSRPKPSLSKAASSAPVRKGACSTSSYATNDDDLLPASTADPRADAVRAAALRAASGRELATVRPDGTIMEDGEGFNRERCFPRQTGRMNYKDFDVNREGTRVAVVLPCLITWLADLSSEGTRGDIRSAAASSFLESAQTLSQLEPYYTTTQSGVLFGTVRAVEKAVDAPVRDGWSILTIDLCRSASSSDGEDWGDDGTGEDGEPIASIRLPWLPPKSPLINAPYTLLASAYSASPPASMKPGAQMRMLFSTGKASEGEWHEGRVYALQIRAEDVARGWPLSRFRAVRVIWYDQLAEGAQPWFMEATQVDCHLSPWEVTTTKLPFVSSEFEDAFKNVALTFKDAQAVLLHVAATEAATVFQALPSRAEVPHYFTRIANPLSFEQLHKRSKNGDYAADDGTGIAALWTDMRTIVSNAKAFNAPYTLFWRLADALEHECRRVKRAYAGTVSAPVMPMSDSAHAAGAASHAGAAPVSASVGLSSRRGRGAATPFDEDDVVDDDDDEAFRAATVPVDMCLLDDEEEF